MKAYQIIKRPIITEKNTNLMEYGKYTFEVTRDATKPQIKRAVEQIFGVTVEKVNTLNVRGKKRRRGNVFGYAADWKKAIVTLVEGDHIEEFES
jgi:large subunit ribosomal protein L23